MERVPRQQYTTEFREQAVRLVLEQKLGSRPVPEHVGQYAQELGGASPASLRQWERTDDP